MIDTKILVEEKKKVNNKYSKIYFIIIFLFIYISDDTLLFGTNSSTLFISLKYIYIISLAIIFFIIIMMKGKMQKKTLLYFLSMIFFIIITMIVNNDIRLGYFYKIFLFINAIAICKLISLKEFAKKFNKIMYVLALISIGGFIIMNIMPNVMKIFPIVINSANMKFYNALLFVTPTSFYSGFIRNYGIFREPGVYQMYLIIAMIFQMFLLNENSIKKYIIYGIAIITTMSTTGYIALIFVGILLVLNKQDLERKKKIMITIIMIIGIIIMVAFTDLLSFSSDTQYNSVFGKIGNTQRATTVARLASVTENIRITKEYPFFGAGLGLLEKLFPIYSFERYGYHTVHNTNTVLIQFASHGILFGVLWCWAYCKFVKRISKKNSLIILVIIAILFIGENLTFSMFSNIFLAYGIITNKYEKIKEG